MLQDKQIPGKASKRGGNRKNAGRKKKYGEATKVVTYRIPISKVPIVRQAVKYILENHTTENESFTPNNY